MWDAECGYGCAGLAPIKDGAEEIDRRHVVGPLLYSVFGQFGFPRDKPEFTGVISVIWRSKPIIAPKFLVSVHSASVPVILVQ